MAKIKTTFFCQNCGAQSPKWLGKCPACGEWNTYVEEVVQKEESGKGSWKPQSSTTKKASVPKKIHEVNYEESPRYVTGDDELDRVLGGGIVPGSLVLIGGEPGIGKSTLMLQIALILVGKKILYVSGEESEAQIKMRADRMAAKNPECYVLSETNTQQIFQQIEALKPDLLVIDSIQTLTSQFIESAAGSVSQVRECTAELMKFAKETGTPVFLIGHITKDGSIAGPKVLEHMVDTVLQFEGDRHMSYRILRTSKNRFGSTHELGIYEMRVEGLRPVANPSEILLTQREEVLNGVAIGAMMEGNRPLLIEIQSLVSPATYGTPQRSSTGHDAKRLNMLLAVLEKRGGMKLGQQDVFLNVAGGLRVDDPALDLAVCASLISSYEDTPVSEQICFAGEVGLGGEIRAVHRIENRIAEAEKLGFKKIIVSKYAVKGLDLNKYKIEVMPVSKLEEVYQKIF
ncbi:DNA replication and repair protein RadA [Algoriphagus ratkowskyi]|uniref:DNA repair protein RadA n=1 Tax=Algoriphagus ratkowskyi TaxID=57028 RepID=A0A2W7SAS7_9BACT|nr:DNA repair protein RadA [Algoriphagus ratkowskyi]PZX59935.1 DNA replication and repair protein RadA [Algoriphagus ratkowskyi]TXD78363.1 DNA repair protein RadA [Algoriphagus ratkowskyi]